MTYSIVFSSKTGNTQRLAQAIRNVLPQHDCLFFGPPCGEALKAQRIYAGFWTDKGSCDRETAAFLEQLTSQQIFLFGTAGFGGAPDYFESILARVRQHLPDSARVIGSYMCQGKMPAAVRQRYEGMADSPNRTAMLDNFDRALHHPDAADLERLQQIVQQNA